VTTTILAMTLAAGAASYAALPPGAGESNDFVLKDSGGAAKEARGATPSKIEATKGDAAMKFIVVDKDKGPVKGVVIALANQTGGKFYTEETDATGYAEVLVPVGQKYELTYLSLGRKDIAATVSVTNEPKQNVRLTLRYKGTPAPPAFVLKGITFDTAKATIKVESLPRLDIVVEFMAHKKSARVEIAGHTDNVGNAKTNKTLSQKRAEACRAYVVSKGIDRARIDVVGYGGERPVAGNATEEDRQLNRRIEARELAVGPS
jgi:outer membrane protein OmpA-like peptidoglycan-associated protein